VPTFAEAWFSNFNFDMWVGMFVAAKTLQAVADRLYQDASKAIQAPEVRKQLATVGGQRCRR
jgi:tripartite-type tricarboxylate transporter receptor subunit TctC